MTTQLSLFQQELPDFLKSAEPNALTKSLAGNTANKKISIRGNVFRMVVGGEEIRKSDSRSLQFIIVNASPHVARQFYEGAYNPENKAAADCWSLDGKAPDATAAKPQGTKCDTCPQNIKGSGQNGGRACRFLRRLAVILPDAPDVYQLVVPPQSLFGKGDKNTMPFDQYLKYVASNRRNIDEVITQATFDTDSATPKLFFDAVAHVSSQEQLDMARAAGLTEDAQRAITYSVSAVEGAGNTNKALPKPAEANPEPQKGEVAEPQEEEVAEPKKREGKASKAEPAPKKDLQDIMKQWAE
jgi:hypothetical protein